MERPIRWPLVPIVVAVTLLSTSPTAADEPPAPFYDAFEIAGRYHRQLSLLPALYQGQPESADLEFRRLTQEALIEQREIDLHPCFARWWAYEVMGLELMALSHELREHPAAVDAEGPRRTAWLEDVAHGLWAGGVDRRGLWRDTRRRRVQPDGPGRGRSGGRLVKPRHGGVFALGRWRRHTPG